VRHYFFDSSTFLKLFVVEEGATRVRTIVRAAQSDRAQVRVAICDLAHPECVSAMKQMIERGLGGRRGLSVSSFQRTLPELAMAVAEGSVFTIVQASEVIEAAAKLASRHRIKGADSVHVAAAQNVRRRVPVGDEFWFVSADLQQGVAARHEGLEVLDPTA
jgi:predicted nucleic acid-binding protein